MLAAPDHVSQALNRIVSEPVIKPPPPSPSQTEHIQYSHVMIKITGHIWPEWGGELEPAALPTWIPWKDRATTVPNGDLLWGRETGTWSFLVIHIPPRQERHAGGEVHSSSGLLSILEVPHEYEVHSELLFN